MKILTEGYARRMIKPNKVIINLYFRASGKTYDEALKKGFNDIETFKTLVLLENVIKEEELKSGGFSVNEEKEYDEDTKKMVATGYVFGDNSKLVLDYNNELLTNILNSLSSLNNPPDLHFNFGIDSPSFDEELTKEAYEEALENANNIAKAANVKIKEVISIEAKNNKENLFLSNTSFDNTLLKLSSANISFNTINPEDITVEKLLSCIFEAE